VDDYGVAHDIDAFGVDDDSGMEFAGSLAVIESEAHLLELHAEEGAEVFRDAFGAKERDGATAEGERGMKEVKTGGYGAGGEDGMGVSGGDVGVNYAAEDERHRDQRHRLKESQEDACGDAEAVFLKKGYIPPEEA
jgi:hypothetical protein